MLPWSLALLFAPLEVVDLEVDGPACADADRVREATVRYLGREDLDQLDARITAHVRVREGDDAWSVDIDVDLPEPLPDTHREVSAIDCAEAVDIAGLIISVALDPVAVSRESVTLRDTTPAEPAPPSETPTPTPTVREPGETEAPRKLHPRISLAGLFGVGQAERLSWGVAGGADVEGRSWQVGARLRYWGPRRVAIAEAEAAGVRLQSLLAGLRGCVVPRLPGWRFPACATADAGVLIARGYGLELNQSTRLPLVSLGAEQSFSWEPGRRIALDLSIGTQVQLIRPRVVIDGLGLVHARSPVIFYLGLGPSFRL